MRISKHAAYERRMARLWAAVDDQEGRIRATAYDEEEAMGLARHGFECVWPYLSPDEIEARMSHVRVMPALAAYAELRARS